MKKFIAFVVGLTFFTLSVKGDFIIKQKVENFGRIQEVTFKIKGSKCRIDVSQQTSAIIDSADGGVIMLMHPKKVYARLGAAQLQAQADALKNVLGNKNENPADVELKPTGKKQIIAGYETEEYTARINGLQMNIFIAKNFSNYQDIVRALYGVQNGPGMETFRNMAIPPEKYPGMPIRTETELMGQKVIATLDSAEQTFVADAEFSIPGDYKELNPAAQQKPTQKEGSPGQ